MKQGSGRTSKDGRRQLTAVIKIPCPESWHTSEIPDPGGWGWGMVTRGPTNSSRPSSSAK